MIDSNAQLKKCADAAQTKPALSTCLDAYADRTLYQSHIAAVDNPTPPEIAAYKGMTVVFLAVFFVAVFRLISDRKEA